MLRNIVSTNIITILTIVSMVLVALAKLIDSKRFLSFFSIAFGIKYVRVYYKGQPKYEAFNLFLFFNAIISLSLFTFIVFYKSHVVSSFDSIFILKCIAGGIAFYMLKTLIEKSIGYLFDISEVIKEYSFFKLSFFNFLGLLLVLINLLIVFSFKFNTSGFYIAFFIIGIIFVIGQVFYFKERLYEIKNSLFYFILYLCALEISPYVLLYKFVTTV